MKQLHTLFGDKMIKLKSLLNLNVTNGFHVMKASLELNTRLLSQKSALLSVLLTPYDEKVSLLTPEQLYFGQTWLFKRLKVIHSHHTHHSFRFTRFN